MAKAAAKASPVRACRLPEMPAVPGVRLAACEAGIRYRGRTDLMLAVLDAGTTVAGVLTRSKTARRRSVVPREPEARPGARAGRQLRQRQRLHRQDGQRGRAHHGGGRRQGRRAARPSEVFIASTGVIGEPLEAEKFAHLLGGLAERGQADAWRDRGARHHDHRYLSQAGNAHGRIGGTYRSSSTASPRAPA